MTDEATLDAREQRIAELEAEIERLGVLLDLIDSRTGWTMLGRIEKRLNAITYALNQASKIQKARRWLRRKLHPDAAPLYVEAMTNMAGAVAEAAAHAVVEGRFAANAVEENERLREAIRQHRDRFYAFELRRHEEPSSRDVELWALLDED